MGLKTHTTGLAVTDSSGKNCTYYWNGSQQDLLRPNSGFTWTQSLAGIIQISTTMVEGQGLSTDLLEQGNGILLTMNLTAPDSTLTAGTVYIPSCNKRKWHQFNENDLNS